MGSGPEDWGAVLRSLEQGDRVAVVKVTGVITAFLAHYRAYDLRDSWDDLCQEVLISLIRSQRSGAIRDPAAFLRYTGTITRNALTDWVEAKRKPGNPDLKGNPDALQGGPQQTQRGGVDSDTLLDLRRALGGLPEKERKVMEAVYLQGMSYQDAAVHLEMPLGTLKRMQTQGLKDLRKIMGVGSHLS